MRARPAAVIAAIAALTLTFPACGDNDNGGEGGRSAVVTGTGYSYDLPGGWVDGSDATGAATEELGLGADAIDTLATDDLDAEFAANINVATGPAPPTADLRVLEAVSLDAVRNPQSLPPGVEFTSPPAKPVDAELDGVPARQFDYTGTFQGNDAELRQLIAIHDRHAFAITFASPAGQFDADTPTFDAVTESWRWASD